MGKEQENEVVDKACQTQPSCGTLVSHGYLNKFQVWFSLSIISSALTEPITIRLTTFLFFMANTIPESQL